MKIQSRVLNVWQRLSRSERRLVRSRAKNCCDAHLRNHCKVILSLVGGNGARAIAKVGLCSISQVYRVAHRFVEHGPAGLADQREDNGDTKADEYFQAVVLEVVGGSSPRKYGYRRPTWTQELLALVLEKKTGTRVSCTTMCRVLKRLKIRLGRPKPIVGCPWKKARRIRRIRELQRVVESVPRDDVVVYVDEVDIHLNPKIGPDYMLRGTQKNVLTPGKNEKRYLAGALNARTGRLTWVEADRKDSNLFVRQLWQLAKQDYPQARCIHIILDNYKIHSSQHTQLALGALGSRVKLHFLPPYCPDHNRIERTWRDLHDNVTRNHTCRTMNELMGEVRDYLVKRDKELQLNYPKKRAA
jgi:transposase